MVEIEDGDSNEVCLAKTMIKLQESYTWDTIDDGTVLSLIEDGAKYAGEVLNARAD